MVIKLLWQCKRINITKTEREWFEWLSETNSQTLQATLKYLDWAYKMFFRKTHNFPNFKSKKTDKSFSIPQNVSIYNWKLSIPKFKEWIKIKLHRPLEWDIINATISMNCIWEYFVSIACEVNIKEKEKIDKNIWIDLWLKDFVNLGEVLILIQSFFLYLHLLQHQRYF